MFRRLVLVMPIILLIVSAAFAGDADDPFSLKNKATSTPLDTPAKQKEPKVAPEKPRSVADVIDFEVAVEPKQAQRGQTVKLIITGTPRQGYYTYSRTIVTGDQTGRMITRVKFKETPGVVPLWPAEESKPELGTDDVGLTGFRHKKQFTWTQDLLILPDAKEEPLTLPFTIDLQVCDKNRCIPGIIELKATIGVIEGEPLKLSAELEKRRQQPEPQPTVVTPDAANPDGTVSADGTGSGLLAFMLTGVFWGAVSLITPCVFPMIPITVSYFLKQSEKEHHRPIAMASVYCATIVIVLTIAAVALLSVFRELSTNPIMNIVIGGLFIYFALSLFGMYEIELPSGLARFTSAREGQGGLVGTIFMALTFTIISFACVAPFLGGFGGTAANSNITLGHRILGGLAFAITFAAPFFILALFPSLLKKMPKSGSWLNTVKVVMGFLEFAAALKFLRAGELVLLPEAQYLTYDFVLGLYVALAILCGLYLLGVYRLPHDTPSENLGVPRMLFALVFLGLGFYLLPALFKYGDKGQSQRPNGVVFAWLDSFLLPDEHSDLPWIGDLKRGLARARDDNKLVFVDFTGETCTNCKLNERDVFPQPEVKDLLLKYTLVALYTDKVPNSYYSSAERSKLGRGTSRQRADAEANLKYQREKFDTEQLPLYVVLEPLANGDYREVARYAEGRIIDTDGFIRFLQQPLARKSAQARAPDQSNASR